MNGYIQKRNNRICCFVFMTVNDNYIGMRRKAFQATHLYDWCYIYKATLLVLQAVVLSLSITLFRGGMTQSLQQLIELSNQFVDAFNKSDLDAVMSFFAEDAEYEDLETDLYQGCRRRSFST
tara:strand:- start:20212 stop:20577 length:366 start_codon:yes stop_codon:yes gene_type:complete